MTATINRSQIFKNAWNFVRTLALSISEALKRAWAEAKNGIGAMAVIAEEVKTVTFEVTTRSLGKVTAIVEVTEKGIKNGAPVGKIMKDGKEVCAIKSVERFTYFIKDHSASLKVTINGVDGKILISKEQGDSCFFSPRVDAVTERKWSESEGCYVDITTEYINGKKIVRKSFDY
jgi:hypothetical protein